MRTIDVGSRVVRREDLKRSICRVGVVLELLEGDRALVLWDADEEMAKKYPGLLTYRSKRTRIMLTSLYLLP